jgi:ATP-dependent Clp protease ATP-binding subunit ClpC
MQADIPPILLVTVTKVEIQALLKAFGVEAKQARRTGKKKTYYDLGLQGGAPVFMVQSEAGSAMPGGALLTVSHAIRDLHPQAVILCGVAYGLCPEWQQLGEILVAQQIQYYEPKSGRIARGDRTTASERLLDRLHSADLDWGGAPVHFGLVLSGEKQGSDPALRGRLLEAEPGAIGGEMEGAGLYAATRDAGGEWILVKAIASWAGEAEDAAAQSAAAAHAAQFVLYTLQVGGWENGKAMGSSSGAGGNLNLPVPAVQPFPEHFAAELPHPLACAVAAFNGAPGDAQRWLALDQLLVNLTKYLLAMALSQYWQDNPERETLRRWLSKLSGANLITSLAILDRVCQHYADLGQENPLQAALFGPYRQSLPATSPLGLATQAFEAQQPGAWGPISAQGLFHRLLALREARWESDPAKFDPQQRSTLLPPLHQALAELIQHFQPLLKYPLYYIENVTTADCGWIYTLTAFSGAEGTPLAVAKPCIQADGKAPKYQRGYLYWCAPDGTPLLNLHPILIEHHLKLYFLECGVEKEDIWYRHCASPQRYHPPEYYHFLSQSWRDSAQAAQDENDPAVQLDMAREELRKADQDSRIEVLPLNILLARLSDGARAALAIGLGEALRIGQFWLGVEFVLMGLSKLENGLLAAKLAEIGLDGGDFRGALRGLAQVNTAGWRKQRDVQALGAAALPQLQVLPSESLAALYDTPNMPKAILTPRLLGILRDAVRLAGESQAAERHLLRAILAQSQAIAVNLLLGLLFQTKQDPRHWMKQLEQEPEADPQPDPAPAAPQPVRAPRSPMAPPNPKGVLGQLGRDLTALAQAGALRPAVGEGARKAMTQIGLILQQTQANNPILLGDPGVGKTAVAEGLAWRLANDPQVIAKLAGKRIIDLSPNALMAGTKYRGDLEERIGQLLAEVRAAKGEIIVFIDEIHTILGGRAEGGLGALSDALKPALARGEFPCIGATTVGEYRRYIEADQALARRFTPVWLEEPSPDEAVEIASQVARDHLGPSHKVEYPHEVIVEAVRLAVRYLHDEFLPGKVIKLLDQAGPRVTMGFSLRGVAADPTLATGGKVTLEIVRQIVAERTGIPLASLSQGDKSKLLGLEESLKQRVKGQDEAVAEVARMVKRARAGLSDPGRPLGVFLFAGPTGVGKTELALALAETLFDQEDASLRLDMSEYLEMHQISRLIGSPPGYIGHAEEGQLTGHLRRRPYSVVLLDEIEKAHKDVQHLFLQLFDAGRITDSRGHVADGRNAIFVMTTNLGAREALGFATERKPYEEQLQIAIEKHFTAEFLGRVSRVIYFKPLSEELLLAIFDKFLAQATQRFQAQGITLEVAEPFKRALCQKHSDPKRGARPLQCAIEDEIIAPLTDKLLAGEIGPGMRVIIGAGDQVEARKLPPAAEPKPPTPALQSPPPVSDEAANLALLQKLVRQFEQESGLSLTLAEGAREILCSPYWAESRKQLTTPQAFEKFVRAPLLEQIQAGTFQAGESVEVLRNIDHIDFKKRAGGKK